MTVGLEMRLVVHSQCRKCRCDRESYYGKLVLSYRRTMVFRTRKRCRCGSDIVMVRPRVLAATG